MICVLTYQHCVAKVLSTIPPLSAKRKFGFQPLRQLQDSNEVIEKLPKPLKTCVRFVKLAGLVARP